ncbi:MAG TPA: co-chaperone GroES [Candidatus Paceibacterota bacterium]|nr:co-chaperone GroES [Candidatus Paceibacterota bacterium]
MAKKLQLMPLGDRIVVLPADTDGEKKLASGIIIPETVAKDKVMQGKVVAVGKGRRTDSGAHLSPEVSVGDVVLFKKPWEEPIKIDGTEYFVLSEGEILGIRS